MQWKCIFSRYHVKKVSWKEGDCARTVNASAQLSYWCSGASIFLECSSMLNTAPVTNAFLSYTWLSQCFFFWCFFFYILTKFLFCRSFDNVLIKKYSLCDHRGDNKAFKILKICGVKASEFCLFNSSFCWTKKWIEYLIFHFVFTLQITKK